MCKKRNRRWDVCVNIHKRSVHYSLGQVPSLPAQRILKETMCSAVQLVVEVTVVEGRALLFFIISLLLKNILYLSGQFLYNADQFFSTFILMSLYFSCFLLRMLFSLVPECISFNLIRDSKLHTRTKQRKYCTPLCIFINLCSLFGQKVRDCAANVRKNGNNITYYVCLSNYSKNFFPIGCPANIRNMRCEISIFRTAFAELRRVNISYVKCVCPSVSVPSLYPHEITRLP